MRNKWLHVNKRRSLLSNGLLVEGSREQLPFYKRNEYNETLTCKDFIDPFFKALGWDMNNSPGYAEAYREVNCGYKYKIFHEKSKYSKSQ